LDRDLPVFDRYKLGNIFPEIFFIFYAYQVQPQEFPLKQFWYLDAVLFLLLRLYLKPVTNG
jgi:hypothetical protein